MELADFLLARIANEEEEAPYVHHENCDSLDESPCDCPWPERIKTECEAKRRLIDFGVTYGDDLPFPDETPGEHQARTRAEAMTWSWTVRVLALPYAGHADFDEGWRP